MGVKDFWANREIRMVCGTCMYFLPKKKDLGRCKRHCPTMQGYPAVFKDEPGCGDHKLNENAI